VGDFIITTGDMIHVMIDPPAIIPQLEAPIPLEASTNGIIVDGMPACVLGDEVPPPLRGLMSYTLPPFTIPGTGTLQVFLEPDNMAVQTTTDGKPLLIRGRPFPVAFTVAVPAMQPTPAGPLLDPEAMKPGTAQFVTTNETVIAS
jgi:hypothetical protein